ncbi:MAG: hybrid sensor histidine kinase/response regulator [Sulfurimonas sp.]|nr:MAG: hybrid sensor histidine kinase/response regulator [Sulfurimonas sp.]
MDNKPYIIAIDDTPYNLEILTMILVDIDVEVECVESGSEAFKLIKKRTPELILLDILMPEMDGFEVCRILKEDPSTSSIPIIFLSALDDIDSKIRAFEVGGADYITKPFNTLEVAARVKTHLRQHYMLEELNVLLKESFHEIYTPLGLIKSSLSLLELENVNNVHLQNIKSSVQSLHSVYEDMYYAIKKEVHAYPAEWIDFEVFLKNRTNIFISQMSYKKLTFDINIDIESPMIKINIIELERLIDNLLSNAIKYANINSTITIDIAPSDEKIKLVISNRSKKIKDAKKLFNELYREDHSVMGLGIGLSIVKKICDKYNISIDVSSNDEITSFILIYKENE